MVQLDRRSGAVRNEDGVRKKFGVFPASIPDYLALVGDSADGFPGLPGWGPKSAATVLSRYLHLESIPRRHESWPPGLRNAPALGAVLRERWSDALLFRDLATLRTDAHVFERVAELEWKGPAIDFGEMGERLNAPETARLADELARR